MEAEVTIFAGNVWTVRNGKIARIAFYVHRSDAFEAAGLSEHDALYRSPVAPGRSHSTLRSVGHLTTAGSTVQSIITNSMAKTVRGRPTCELVDYA